MTKTQQAVARARAQLWKAIDRACVARGEAQWTNGYRAAKFAGRVAGGQEEERLYAKEIAQFSTCGMAERRVDQLILALVRVVRRTSALERTHRLSRGRSHRASAPRKVRRA